MESDRGVIIFPQTSLHKGVTMKSLQIELAELYRLKAEGKKVGIFIETLMEQAFDQAEVRCDSHFERRRLEATKPYATGQKRR